METSFARRGKHPRQCEWRILAVDAGVNKASRLPWQSDDAWHNTLGDTSGMPWDARVGLC
jgi:hypothetical protein